MRIRCEIIQGFFFFLTRCVSQPWPECDARGLLAPSQQQGGQVTDSSVNQSHLGVGLRGFLNQWVLGHSLERQKMWMSIEFCKKKKKKKSLTFYL